MNTAEEVLVVIAGDNDWNRTIESRVEGLTKKAYSWSKYGGSNYGLVQEAKTKEWYCQACRELQASELPSYMFEFSDKEFIRICAVCQATKHLNHITGMTELLKLVRKMDELW